MSRMLFTTSAIGWASGITAGSLFVFPLSIFFLPLLLAIGIGSIWFYDRKPVYACLFLFLLFLSLAGIRTNLASRELPEAFQKQLGTHSTYTGVVAADPDIRETTQRVTVRIQEAGKETNVLVVAPLYPSVSYGEAVRVSGTLTRPESFETDTGRTFRYDRYLAKDGIFALIQSATIEQVAPRQGIGTHILGSLFDAKEKFLDGIGAALPEPVASLAAGLIAGGKQGLGKELLQSFIVVGLVHIVVLSGYNVMIIAEAVLRFLSLIPKRMAAGIAGVFILAFVVASGAGAASIRAGIMAGLGLLARVTNRQYAVFRALIAAAFLMLLMNPLLLIYDPGFQLSFVATLGLIFGSPKIAPLLTWIRYESLREILSSTVAAQIAVLPLLLYQTGILSLVALPANILVLPFVPLAMLLSFIAGVIGMIAAPIAPLFGLPAAYLLSGIIELVRFLSSLPLASIIIPPFSFLLLPILYAALFLWWRKGQAVAV